LYSSLSFFWEKAKVEGNLSSLINNLLQQHWQKPKNPEERERRIQELKLKLKHEQEMEELKKSWEQQKN
jgi:predicted RNase H-like nuclease (RuvC/YqgF family)